MDKSTAQLLLEMAEKEMQAEGHISMTTYRIIEETIEAIDGNPIEYFLMDGKNFILNVGRWKYRFLEK